MQKVVFNAHYLAYCDDAADLWFRAIGAGLEDGDWDVMVKNAVITWSGAARLHDELIIDIEVSRWGTTSFDVAYSGSVGERPVFTASVTYVGVHLGTTETMAPPDEVRRSLGEAGAPAPA